MKKLFTILTLTLLSTEKGLIPIKEISKRKEVDIDIKTLNFEGKNKKASKLFNSGKHKIMGLKTAHGFNLEGTYNHPVLCWKVKDKAVRLIPMKPDLIN